MSKPHVLLAVPASHAAPMGELVQAWRDSGATVSIETYANAMPPIEQWVRESGNDGESVSAALLLGPARRAPATVLTAPFATNKQGCRVPVAWLPATTPSAVRRFAATAARTHRRTRQATGGSGVALLAQWQRQYLQVVDRMAVLVAPVTQGFRWTADALLREDMVRALGSGLGLGIYVGHGRPVGWVGYHGTRGHHFDAFDGEPLGALVSLCCRTASRRRCGLSYAEALPLRGVCSASLGAVGDTLHTDNTRWAVGLCDALLAGAQTIGELVARGAPISPAAVASYRLIGDPLAPLAAAGGGLRRARSVHLHV